ncbi:hypothetical protein [Paracoccus cavernae]|uniref:hypothetical protein n=1 Tax=Paracoccus cavernae TaxID=1571207 RepID=UPI003639EF3F
MGLPRQCARTDPASRDPADRLEPGIPRHDQIALAQRSCRDRPCGCLDHRVIGKANRVDIVVQGDVLPRDGGDRGEPAHFQRCGCALYLCGGRQEGQVVVERKPIIFREPDRQGLRRILRDGKLNDIAEDTGLGEAGVHRFPNKIGLIDLADGIARALPMQHVALLDHRRIGKVDLDVVLHLAETGRGSAALGVITSPWRAIRPTVA